MVQGTGQATGWVKLARKKAGWVTSQLVFASSKKNRVQVGYFSGQVRKF